MCGDEATLQAIAADPRGGELDAVDRAVYEFAGMVDTGAVSVQQSDIDRLRTIGLTDADIADIAFAAAARSFFTRVLDGLGARLDPQTAAVFPPPLLRSMIVGRPVAGQ